MTNLKVRDCRWIKVPGVSDARGSLNFLEFGDSLGFQPRRIFWLHHVAPDQWRGRHGHRESQLLFVAMNGHCLMHLDDGRVREQVRLEDPGSALYVGPWVWHELTDFSPQTAVVVIASSFYDEAEYLRDYEAFLREIREQVK